MDTILFWEYQNGPIHLIGWHIYYLIALFSLLAWVLGKFLFKPVIAVIEEREGRVSQAEKAAREAQKQLEDSSETGRQALLEARREAFLLREEAQKAASSQAEGTLGKAREKARTRVEKALGEIETQAGDARGQLKKEALTLAEEITSQVLGRGKA